MCLSLGTALPFYQLSLAQLSLSLFLLFYLSCLCIPKLRPASRNMAQHCGSKSHDHPSPNPLCFSRLFLKSRLWWTCAHAQCRIHFFRHVEFYFRFRQLISFPVWGQLYCACLGEGSSTIFSGNKWGTLHCYMSPIWGLMSSSLLRPFSFLGCLHWGRWGGQNIL